MSPEGLKIDTKSESTVEDDSSGYDREGSFEEAEAEMETMLSEIELPEDLNPEFSHAYRIHVLFNKLDSADTDNRTRFVAMALNELRAEVLGNLSSFKLNEFNDYLRNHPMQTV